MKIAILTVPFNNNYGGFLQAFALKKILEERGHSVEFLMRRRYRPKISVSVRLKNLLNWLLKRTDYCYFLNDFKIYRISKFTRRFVRDYLFPLSKNCYNKDSFSKLLFHHQADVYIAGSDQCWRYKFAPWYIDDYFFKPFLGTKRKRISYAASFGVDFLEYDEKMLQICEKCLKEFSAISVREESGVRLLEEFFHIPQGKAVAVLDPTMLLPLNYYDVLIKKYPIKDHNYLFSYILDDSEEIEDIISQVCRDLNLNRINQKAQTGDLSKIQIIEPVELWLSRIYNSSFVLTDSFHGVVFSILFNKSFFVFENESRGKTRFDSVLTLFNLNNRYIHKSSNISKSLVEKEIDWNYVNHVMVQKRIDSLDFLFSALKSKSI